MKTHRSLIILLTIAFIPANLLSQQISSSKFTFGPAKEVGPDDGTFKSYSERLRLFVNEFRQKDGIPVIISN